MSAVIILNYLEMPGLLKAKHTSQFEFFCMIDEIYSLVCAPLVMVCFLNELQQLRDTF